MTRVFSGKCAMYAEIIYLAERACPFFYVNARFETKTASGQCSLQEAYCKWPPGRRCFARHGSSIYTAGVATMYEHYSWSWVIGIYILLHILFKSQTSVIQ